MSSLEYPKCHFCQEKHTCSPYQTDSGERCDQADWEHECVACAHNNACNDRVAESVCNNLCDYRDQWTIRKTDPCASCVDNVDGECVAYEWAVRNGVAPPYKYAHCDTAYWWNTVGKDMKHEK